MKKLVCLLLLLSLLSGCWSRREITEVAFGGLMAIDWVDDAYLVTLNILLPPQPGGGSGAAAGGQRGGGGDGSVWTIQTQAASIDEAIGRLDRISPRRVFLSHVRAVVFGEAMARRGIRPPLDALSRSVEIRPTLWVGVTPGLGGELLLARPTLELYPANGPLGYHDLIPRRGSLGPAQRLVQVVALLLEEGIDLSLPALHLTAADSNPRPALPQPDPEVLIGGAALFKDDRLTGWLQPEEARGLLWANNTAQLGTVQTPCPEGEGWVVHRLRDSSARLRAELRGDALAVEIRIAITTDINEVLCPHGPTSAAELRRFEQALAAEVAREVQSALAKMQEHGSDALGIGQALFRANPRAYRELAERWSEVFTELEVDLQIAASVRRVGQKYGILGERYRPAW